MKVRQIMKTGVGACRPDDNGSSAARIMWERDCGFVPVVDEHSHVLAVVTDRDLCMAAYTQGKSLPEIPVRRAMSKEVWSCRPDDDLSKAETSMREHQVRRLPVTDGEGQLKGVLSLSDITREAAKEAQAQPKNMEVSFAEVAQTLADINIPRPAPQAQVRVL